MIRTRDLTRRYPDGGGISGVSLAIPAGGTCAIIGPSGCGKTTLLHILADLTTADGGVVERPAGSRVGLVQQQDALFPWLTGAANIRLGYSLAPDAATAADHEDHLIDILGIAAILDRYPAEMSGGERQRVSLARTLVGRPDILLLDEPSSALDAFSREELQNLLVALHEELRFTALYVTHSIEEALFLADTVVVMKQGTVHRTHANPLYPDPGARSDRRFYEQVIALRGILQEAIGNA